MFQYVADLEHTPEWNWAITETTQTTPGPLDIGTRYRQTRSVPQPSTEELEVVALEKDRRIDVRGTLAGLPAYLSYRFEQKQAGTRLANIVELQPTGALKLLGPLVGGRIERAVAENLQQLKRLLETSQSSQ